MTSKDDPFRQFHSQRVLIIKGIGWYFSLLKRTDASALLVQVCFLCKCASCQVKMKLDLEWLSKGKHVFCYFISRGREMASHAFEIV